MKQQSRVLALAVPFDMSDRFAAAAALEGKTLPEWALDAMREKADLELSASREPAGGQGQPAPTPLEMFLKRADTLHPAISAGTVVSTDAAEDIRRMREERVSAIGD